MRDNIRQVWKKIQHIKLNINKKNLRIALMVCLVLVLSISGTALAKYYATRNNKGVSVAAGLYFNSNCLGNVPGEIKELPDVDVTTMPGYVNKEGGNIFHLEIRNYDNHILFNELYLDVEYTISFMLVEGASASIEYKDESGTITNVPLLLGQPVTLTGQILPGGTAYYDSYTVTTENTTDGKKAKVMVMAYPTAPDYVASAKEEMRLVGVLQAEPKIVEVGIDTSRFLIEDRTEFVTDWKNQVEKMSGLVYAIKTNGDDVSSSTGAIKGELEVTWNSRMLDINQYDPYYLDAMEEDTITTNGDLKTMRIRVLPYANIKITFYKTADFVKAFDDGTMTKEAFQGYVKATLPDVDATP